MTESEIQLLKDNVDKTVEIVTIDGERLVAKILFVTHCDEYDEHELLYEMICSNKSEPYAKHADSGGYVLGFDRIVSVVPSGWRATP